MVGYKNQKVVTILRQIKSFRVASYVYFFKLKSCM